MTTATKHADDRSAGARAEFYLCLAHAFRPPAAARPLSVFVEDLPDDLADLGRELGLVLESEVRALRASLRALPDTLGLLQLYSAQFLTPPAPVSLNASRYLDGAATLGTCAAMLERRYRDHGLERDESFRDLPDHVSLQLEFVAFLLGCAAALEAAGDDAEAARLDAEAREFLATFVWGWLPTFCADLERTVASRGLSAIYLHLAHILRLAVDRDTAALKRPDESLQSEVRPLSREPTAEEIAEIARVLAAKGHSIDHLAIPLGARDAALGLTPANPPTVAPFPTTG